MWHTNFVSRQYLDNTQNHDRALPCYSQTDINASYSLKFDKHVLGLKEIVFGAEFDNIFSRHYAASGWVYSAYNKEGMKDSDSRYYQIGFIPMAGFHCIGNITLKF